MLGRFRNWATLARRFGLVAAAGIVIRWTARWSIHYREALIYQLDLANLPAIDTAVMVEWTYLAPDADLTDPGDRSGSSATPSAASRVFVGRLNGVVCYSSLVSGEGFAVPDRVRVQFLQRTDAYVGDCVTEPEFRGRNIYPAGLIALAHELRNEGKTCLHLFVECENLASIRSVEKAGFRPLVKCQVWRAAGLHRRWRPLDANARLAEQRWSIHVGPTARPNTTDSAPVPSSSS